MPPPLTPDSPAHAGQNADYILAALAGGGTCTLPPGDTHVDWGWGRPGTLLLTPAHSRGTLAGAGANRSRLVAVAGRGLWAEGTGAGYAHYAEAFAGDGTVTLAPTDPNGNPFRPGDWAVGRACWGFGWDSYAGGGRTARRRYVVTAAHGRTLQFDRPADPALTCFKWCDGSAIQDAGRGADAVTLINRDDVWLYRRGQWVAVSGGPVLANELLPEYRQVQAVYPATGVVVLEGVPLEREYTDAALVRIDPVAGLTVRDLTIAQPPGGAETAMFKFCTDLWIEGVQFAESAAGLRLAVPGTGPAFVACGHVTSDSCRHWGQTGVNSCHDFAALFARLFGQSALVCEEGCLGITVADSLLAAPGGQDGVAAWPSVGRLQILRSRVEGYGFQGGYPLLCGGPGLVVRDVTLAGTGPTVARLQGDGLTVERLRSDVPVWVEQGTGITLRDSAAPDWNLLDGTAGTVERCTGVGELPAGWAAVTEG